MTYKNNKQRGFTLIELLVVVGIIAALAAVVIPNVAQFMGRGDTASNEAELQNVQAAMDLYMTDNAVTSVTELIVGSATNDLSGTTPALAPTYLRQNPTKCPYYWSTAGLVSQVTASCN